MTFERDKGYSFLDEELPLQEKVSPNDLVFTRIDRPLEFSSIFGDGKIKVAQLLQSAWEKGVSIEAVFEFELFRSEVELAQGYYSWVILDDDEAIKIFKMPGPEVQGRGLDRLGRAHGRRAPPGA